MKGPLDIICSLEVRNDLVVMTVAVIDEADNFLVVGCGPSFTKGHISGALKKIKPNAACLLDGALCSIV